MFKLLTLTCVSIATLGMAAAHADTGQYTPEQIKEMPRFASIEQQRCPSARFTSVKKRLACKKEVRIENYEKRQARKDKNNG
ncbi:MAG: hypothetical protein ACRBCT_08125 [Alphaproteobacteria bacterium]|jgi:hypothetical protein